MSNVRIMRVNKWGNSLGIRFPSEFVDLIQLEDKSLVELRIDGSMLVISKHETEEPRKTIQELFDMYPADFIEDEEIDWGAPVGGEVW